MHRISEIAIGTRGALGVLKNGLQPGVDLILSIG